MSAMMGDVGLTATLIEGSIAVKHPIWQNAGLPRCKDFRGTAAAAKSNRDRLCCDVPGNSEMKFETSAPTCCRVAVSFATFPAQKPGRFHGNVNDELAGCP
jgi:hypothetical protein